MTFEFRIQDPSNTNTTYLLEEIIKLIQKGNLIKWRGIYSWTTGKTLSKVFIEDPDVKSFLQNGIIELVIGIDTITTDYALIKLRELNDQFERFSSKIFKNDVCDLFHPKISHFEFSNGEHTLLVGSGNFTLTGLQTNIEAYTITSGTADEISSISVWEDFLEYHSERIKEIDEESIEKAKKNRIKIVRTKQALEEPLPAEEEAAAVAQQGEIEETAEIPFSVRLNENSRILVAQVPGAGDRWRQVHYNAAVIEQFFRAVPNSHQRIFLKEIRLDGSVGREEPPRKVVYSKKNKNYKIEISSRPEANDPVKGDPKPIIVLREMGVRNFLYMLILPGDDPFDSLQEFLNENESVGKGLKRVITDAEALKEVWPDSPLVG